MPNGNPLVGEVWETTDPTGRTIRGIVADVVPNVLTLVSFTGNRFRIAPTGMTNSWRYVQAPPPTALRCSRRGCGQPGILRFVRGQQIDWVCPRHLPVGVHATLTHESLGPVRPNETRSAPPPPGVVDAEFTEVVPMRCSQCHNPDPVEDHRIDLLPNCSLWICHRCNARWCVLFGLEAFTNNEASEQRLRNIVDDLRVALALENYSVEQITTTPRILGIFERFAEAGIPGCSVAGINIRWSPEFGVVNQPNTVFRMELRGGPEHRAAPRSALPRLALFGEPRPRLDEMGASLAPSDVSMSTSSLVPIAQESQAAEHELLDNMAPIPFVSTGTRWVNRGTGEIVEVVRLGSSTDGNEPVVHFKRVSDSLEANMVLLQRDFDSMFRSFASTQPNNRAHEPVVEILKDEEWEHVESGEVVKIDTVDTKRNLVTVIAKERRRSVPMADFVNAKWRKIVRKTAFARIMEDE